MENQEWTETTQGKYTVSEGWGEGCFGAFFAFGLGVLLTATGIGAVLGIPMILISLIMPFLGTGMVAGSSKDREGMCPYRCGTMVKSAPGVQGVDCPACARRIVIREGRYWRVS